MKNNKHERLKRKNVRETYLVIIIVLVIGLAILGFALYQKNNRQTSSKSAGLDIVSYIQAKASSKQVSPYYQPVLIYQQAEGESRESFCCVGTMFTVRNSELLVRTAEHMFRTDVQKRHVYSVRLLKGKMDPPVVYFNQIIETGKDFAELKDAVTVKLGTKPVLFDQFSKFHLNEVGQNFWGEVIIGTKKIPALRSLVSGETVKTAGYVRRQGTDEATYVLIDADVRPGESGTGFIDAYQGLWVLHGKPSTESAEQGIKDECFRITGRRLNGIATVSGPFGGRYD